jgi:hypothetical protein
MEMSRASHPPHFPVVLLAAGGRIDLEGDSRNIPGQLETANRAGVHIHQATTRALQFPAIEILRQVSHSPPHNFLGQETDYRPSACYHPNPTFEFPNAPGSIFRQFFDFLDSSRIPIAN